MFDRILYKKTAKTQLKGRLGFPVLMTFIITVLFLCFSFFMNTLNENSVRVSHPSLFSFSFSAFGSWLPTILSFAVIGIIGILVVAQIYVYIKMSRTVEKASFSDFCAGLEKWPQGFLGIFWYTLWTFLWSCLFFIPGIVKSIAYSQMFFVLAENPNTGVRRAMQISKVITQTHKADLFVMGLSFIGWAILCGITCGIGFFWLKPYMNMSFTNAYYALKNQALASGRLSPADFAR
jgi:uncharacterized membrane protein